MTTRRSERISQLGADEPVAASIVLGIRLRQIRERRGLSARSFIERCERLGASGLSTNVLANIETGRRVANVDELLVFALALDVPPVALLVPARERPLTVRVTERMTLADRSALTGWLRGDEALPNTDHEHYAAYAEDLPATTSTDQTNLQATLGRVVSHFNAEIDDLAGRMREQVSEVFSTAAAQAQQGATAEEIVQALTEAGQLLGPPAARSN